jgi:hypothetical protein
MPYIAKNLSHYSHNVVGNGQCVALVQSWAGAPSTAIWTEGIKVKGHGAEIEKGTVIATFEHGHYPNHASGNHAAIYLWQDDHGIHVIDQWKGHAPSERTLSFRGIGGSDDGDAFSVVE